jgi:hypothetical protein
MEEREYYSNHGVTITNKRVVTYKSRTIAVSQINSVSNFTDYGPRMLATFIGAFLGVLSQFVFVPVLQSMLTSPSIGTKALMMFALALLGGCIGWLCGKAAYRFSIITSNGANDGYTSRDSAIVSEMVAALNNAIIENSQIADLDQSPVPSSSTLSPADEILKFKDLLDAGVLTQEEFDLKKKELLGL